MWVLKSLEMKVVEVLPGVGFIGFRDTVPCRSPMLPQKVQLGAEIKMSSPVGTSHGISIA